MAQVGKLKCDFCNFIGDMETFGGKTNLKAPVGWGSIHTTVRIAGERELTPEKRKLLKDKIARSFPMLHACPRCVFADAFNVSRMLESKTG